VEITSPAFTEADLDAFFLERRAHEHPALISRRFRLGLGLSGVDCCARLRWEELEEQAHQAIRIGADHAVAAGYFA
jgi:hypothetical protein